MTSSETAIAIESPPTTMNPLDVIPEEMPFDVPYGPPISLGRAKAVIDAAVDEARRRTWKMNIAVVDAGGNLVAFERMDGAMLASIQIAAHKARAAATFRRPTKIFEDGVQLMHLNYLRVRRHHYVPGRHSADRSGCDHRGDRLFGRHGLPGRGRQRGRRVGR
jgi:glc operon protein GlcG